MDLQSLLTASLELEKRIATDRALRKYFSTVWSRTESREPVKQPPPATLTAEGQSTREMTLRFPAEMCEVLEWAAKATGKTPAEILEEGFVEHYLKKLKS